MEAYKIRVDKLSQTLQGVKSEAETQTDPSPMTPPIKHGRGRVEHFSIFENLSFNHNFKYVENSNRKHRADLYLVV